MTERRPENMERITTPALAQAFIDEQIKELRAQIGDNKVLLALSGGVDSSVVAALLIKAVGKQLISVHVNHGLLRKGEPEQVIRVFRDEMNANLIYVDAVDRFLDKLAGVSDPEEKRHIIGEEFIDVFADEARKLDGVKFLAQGTIWPDILESEAGIKAHHNAGGLPESPSRAPASAYAAPARSPATDSKQFANPTRSFAKSLPRTASRAKYGSISLSFRTSSPPASRTASAPLTGLASSVPSTPPMLWKSQLSTCPMS